MIILSETTDKVQVVLSESVITNQLQCFSSWRNRGLGTAIIAGRTVINTNGATPVDIVGSPTTGQKLVDLITIYNSDTVNATVSVLFNFNSATYILFKATLAPGETIIYQESAGFLVFANSGAIKQSINQGNNVVSSALTAVVLGADVVNNNVTANSIADVTGLSFPVVAGNKYYFKFVIHFISAATTTGSRWSINGPATSELAFKVEIALSNTVNSTNMTSESHVVAYDNPTTCNASTPNNSATGGAIAIIEGFIKPSANGSVIARFASEVSASAITAKAGSVVYYQQIL